MSTKTSILVLGGTQMLGRDFVETLLSKHKDDYNIYLANRGLTNTHLFTDLPKIKIDRNNEESCYLLQYHAFDIVIDFSCYNTNQFFNTYKYLKYKQKYVLISTQSVLDNTTLMSGNDNDPYYRYCLNKKSVEDIVSVSLDISNMVIVRPCAVYGPNDYTDRFEISDDGTYIWKNTKTIADRKSGCIFIKDFTNQLIQIASEKSYNSTTIYNIG